VKIIALHGMLYLLALKGIKEICPVSYIFCWSGIKFSTGDVSKTLLSDSKVFENWPNYSGTLFREVNEFSSLLSTLIVCLV